MVLILFALSLTALLVIGAITVGLGNARQQDRDVQNDVDSAVLAGAQELDGVLATTGDQAKARTRACEYLTQNGYAVASCNAVDFQFVSVDGGECIQRQIGGVEAKVWFGEIAGDDDLELDATAIGCRKQGSTGTTPVDGANVPVAFAGGHNCAAGKPAFETSGNKNEFQGDIVSYGDAKDGGNNNTVTGTRRAKSVSQNKGLWDGWTPVSGAATWPAGFGPSSLPISLYAPAGDRALAYGGFYTNTSQTVFQNTVSAGVYYATASSVEIKGNGFTVAPKTATIYLDPATGLPAKPVANGGTGIAQTRTLNGITIVTPSGLIKISDNNVSIPHFDFELNRLVFFTNWNGGVSQADACDKPVIEFSGNCVHVDGIVYAPRGAINTGSGNQVGNDKGNGSGGGCASHPDYGGGFLGWGLKINGNTGFFRAGAGSLVPSLGPGDIYLGA